MHCNNSCCQVAVQVLPSPAAVWFEVERGKSRSLRLSPESISRIQRVSRLVCMPSTEKRVPESNRSTVKPRCRTHFKLSGTESPRWRKRGGGEIRFDAGGTCQAERCKSYSPCEQNKARHRRCNLISGMKPPANYGTRTTRSTNGARRTSDITLI